MKQSETSVEEKAGRGRGAQGDGVDLVSLAMLPPPLPQIPSGRPHGMIIEQQHKKKGEASTGAIWGVVSWPSLVMAPRRRLGAGGQGGLTGDDNATPLDASTAPIPCPPYRLRRPT